MLALCLMLSVTYYAQNYAGIIGWSPNNWIKFTLIFVRVGLNLQVACNISFVMYSLCDGQLHLLVWVCNNHKKYAYVKLKDKYFPFTTMKTLNVHSAIDDNSNNTV